MMATCLVRKDTFYLLIMSSTTATAQVQAANDAWLELNRKAQLSYPKTGTLQQMDQLTGHLSIKQKSKRKLTVIHLF